jgi:hypothetical protein
MVRLGQLVFQCRHHGILPASTSISTNVCRPAVEILQNRG